MPYSIPGHGVVARTVFPNPKCEDCLHYASQQGPTGLCQIGLQPATCGNGDMPAIGYASITGAAPNHPADLSSSPAQVGKPGPVDGLGYSGTPAMRAASLGEEHVSIVKALVVERRENIRKACPYHQQNVQSSGGSNVSMAGAWAECSCGEVSLRDVAKSLRSRLTNRERATLSDAEIFAFVEASVGGKK